MAHVLRAVDGILYILSGLCITALALLITATVAGRWLLGSEVPDSEVMVRELMIGAVILPLAIVTGQRAHIAVEFVYNMFPTRLQRILTPLAAIVGILAILPLMLKSAEEAWATYQRGSFFFGDLELPQWPGHTLFFVGFVLLGLRLVVQLANDVVAAIRPRSDAEATSSSGLFSR